jgi:hypothetical protein
MMYHLHLDYTYALVGNRLTIVLFGDRENLAPEPLLIYATVKRLLPINIHVSVRLLPAVNLLVSQCRRISPIYAN